MNATTKITVDGAEPAEAVATALVEIVVDSSLRLPDCATVRASLSEGVAGDPFALGKRLEVSISPGGDNAPVTKLFSGEIASLELDAGPHGKFLLARAYDDRSKLQRGTKVAAFNDQTASDVISKVIQGVGAQASVTSTNVKYDFIEQQNESDWDFVCRLAEANGQSVYCDGRKIGTRAWHVAASSPVSLTFNVNLTAFAGRLTNAGQVEKVAVTGWDAKKKEVITGTSSEPQLNVQPSTARAKNGTLLVTDRVVETQPEATELARSVLARIANTYFTGEGTAIGNPQIKAGSYVEIKETEARFNGKFRVSEARHVIRGGDYETHFTIAEGADRDLVSLSSPPPAAIAGSTVMVGVVTNSNDDKASIGRVKVKIPSLDGNLETWWAKVATMAAGKERGALMLPQEGEEVLIAFEGGDLRRPYVLGSLFNSKDTPGPLVNPPDGKEHGGSFVVLSDDTIQLKAKDLVRVTSTKQTELKSEDEFKITAAKDLTITSDAGVTVKASKDGAVTGANFKIEASSGTIELKGAQSVKLSAGASSIELGPSGVTIKGSMISLG